MLGEDDDTAIERVVKEYRESPEVEKSGKVAYLAHTRA
jgi:hypothetical protein